MTIKNLKEQKITTTVRFEKENKKTYQKIALKEDCTISDLLNFISDNEEKLKEFIEKLKQDKINE